MDDTMKCRFCDYNVKKWRTKASGDKVSGFGQLRDHIENDHPDEAEKIYTGNDDADEN